MKEKMEMVMMMMMMIMSTVVTVVGVAGAAAAPLGGHFDYDLVSLELSIVMRQASCGSLLCFFQNLSRCVLLLTKESVRER